MPHFQLMHRSQRHCLTTISTGWSSIQRMTQMTNSTKNTRKHQPVNSVSHSHNGDHLVLPSSALRPTWAHSPTDMWIVTIHSSGTLEGFQMATFMHHIHLNVHQISMLLIFTCAHTFIHEQNQRRLKKMHPAAKIRLLFTGRTSNCYISSERERVQSLPRV